MGRPERVGSACPRSRESSPLSGILSRADKESTDRGLAGRLRTLRDDREAMTKRAAVALADILVGV
jgi:hypothetical protein